MEENTTQLAEPSVETGQVADAPQEQPQRTRQDAQYADNRRKQQLDEARAQLAALKQQLNTRPEATAEQPPAEGDTQAEGETEPRTEAAPQPEDLAGLEQAEDTALERYVMQQLGQLETRLGYYRHQQVQQAMAKDLAEVQAINPKITSLADLPPAYLALRFNSAAPMTASQAYAALTRMETATARAKPRSTGSMDGTGTAEARYYTSRELDRLTAKQLSDPAVMAKAMRSLQRLK